MRIKEFDIDAWNDTKNDFQGILKVLSAIKSKNSPRDRHWYNHALYCTTQMITTDIFEVEGEKRFDALEIELDPIEGVIFLSTQIESEEVPLDGQSPLELFLQIKSIFHEFGIEINGGLEKEFSNIEIELDLETVSKYWRVMQFTALLFQRLKAKEYLFETSPINLWHHNFDLSTFWLSGKFIDGVDKVNQDISMERVNFGLSAGDGKIKEPYYYITTQPYSEKILETKLPKPAVWYQGEWNGAIIKISDLFSEKNQKTLIMDYWQSVLNSFKEINGV